MITYNRLSFIRLSSRRKPSEISLLPEAWNEATAGRDRLTFARARVEITPDCEFPSRVNILAGNTWISQEIHYEWCPPCCQRCNSFDHSKCSEKLVSREEAKENHEDQRKVENNTDWQKFSHGKKNQKLDFIPVSSPNEPEKLCKKKGPVEKGESSKVVRLLQSDEMMEQEIQDFTEHNKEIQQNGGSVFDGLSNIQTEKESESDVVKKTRDQEEDLERASECEASSEEGEYSENEGMVRDSQEIVCESPEIANKNTDEQLNGNFKDDGCRLFPQKSGPPVRNTEEGLEDLSSDRAFDNLNGKGHPSITAGDHLWGGGAADGRFFWPI